MHLPAWALFTWPPVLCQPQRLLAPSSFRHLGTQVIRHADALQRPMGQTLWASADAGAEAGVAWDWVLVGQGVVAMADPMSVLTNLRLIGPEGAMLSPAESARHLSSIVHALPWQREVQRALHAPPLQ